MKSMAMFNVIVRDGHLVSEDRVELPEGTRLRVVTDDDVKALEDEMGPDELAAFRAHMKRSREDAAHGRVISADALFNRLSARR